MNVLIDQNSFNRITANIYDKLSAQLVNEFRTRAPLKIMFQDLVARQPLVLNFDSVLGGFKDQSGK